MRNPRRAVIVAVAAAACLAAGCAPKAAVQGPPPLPPAPHPAAEGPSVTAVQRVGRLRVAADLSVPPMAFRDTTGPRGFDIDLVGLVAQALGVRVQIVDTPAGAMREAFPAEADLAAGALSDGMVPGIATEAYGETAPIVVWGARTAGNTVGALRGRRVSAVAGSAGERLAHDAGAAVVPTYLSTQSLTLVEAGRVDAAIVDGPAALGFVAGHAGFRTAPAGGPAVPLVLVARPQADDLAAYVSAVIRELRADGGLGQLRRRWHL